MGVTIDIEKYYDWYSRRVEHALVKGSTEDIDELNAIHTAFMHLVKKFEVKNG